MSVKFHNFGGTLGWNLQKRFPKLSSESYLKLQFLARNKLQKNECIDDLVARDVKDYILRNKLYF